MAQETELVNRSAIEERAGRPSVDWRIWALPMVILLISAVFAYINPNFLSAVNITNVMRQTSILALLAVGQTLVILTRGIDLSVGSMLAFASVFTADQILRFGIGPGIALGLIAAGLFGILQGVLVTKVEIPAFIVTLGGLTFLRGLAFVYSGGQPVTGLPSEFFWLGSGSIYGIPVPGIIAIIVFVLAHIFLKYTVVGRYLYAIGGNDEAAHVAGININKYRVLTFVISSVLAALAGIILTSRVISGQPTLGEQMELMAIAAVVVGGTSLRGGEGSILQTFLGVALIAIIGNGLNLIRVSSFVQLMVIGVIIVLAVGIDQWYRKR